MGTSKPSLFSVSTPMYPLQHSRVTVGDENRGSILPSGCSSPHHPWRPCILHEWRVVDSGYQVQVRYNIFLVLPSGWKSDSKVGWLRDRRLWRQLRFANVILSVTVKNPENVIRVALVVSAAVVESDSINTLAVFSVMHRASG